MGQLRLQELQELSFLGGVLQEVENDFKAANFTGLLTDEMVDIREDHVNYFNYETDPNGQPWAPLSPRTIKAKGHDTILVDTNAMKTALTSESGAGALRGVSDHGLLYGAEDEKLPFHMEGTKHMPARPPLGLREQRVDQITEDVADYTVFQITG